jgi:hypothetical protein
MLSRFGFRQVRLGFICNRHPTRLTIRSSRPRVVASATCFALRLHASAAPPRVGLTQALGPATGRLNSSVRRRVLLEQFPPAAAAILKHYEMWPTHFIDITRSLQVALSFAEANASHNRCYLYVFAMPDLRGSFTTDIDQHLTLARLEAICPPDAVRPHHQDAYLVSRFPEPSAGGGHRWIDWQNKLDLMRRLVAKFEVSLTRGHLKDAPRVPSGFLIPPESKDPFSRLIAERLGDFIEARARQITA